MNWDTLQQLLRIVIQIAAGWMLNQGLITESMVDTLVGGALSLGGVIWWIVWDRHRASG